MPDDPKKKQEKSTDNSTENNKKNASKSTEGNSKDTAKKNDSIPEISLVEFKQYIELGVRKDNVRVKGLGAVRPVDTTIVLKSSKNETPTKEDIDWLDSLISYGGRTTGGFSIIPSAYSFYKSNDWFWHDAKGVYRSTKLLEVSEKTENFVKGVQGYRYGYQTASKIAKPWGVVGNVASGISVTFTVYDIGKNGKNGSNSLDLYFGMVSFVPEIGWIISGVYTVANEIVKATTGKTIGEHGDSFLSGKMAEIEIYLRNKIINMIIRGINMKKTIICLFILLQFTACKQHNADDYYNNALTLYYNKQYIESIKLYDKAISIAPDIAAYYLNRGTAKDEVGDKDGAMKDYIKALSLDSTDVIVYNNIATIYSEQKKREQAIAYYEKAIQCDSTYFYVYLNYAITNYEVGNYNGTLLQLSKYLRMAPSTHRAAAFYYIGMSYKNLGDNDAAEEFLTAAKEQGFREAGDELKKLK